jgi:phospholipase C
VRNRLGGGGRALLGAVAVLIVVVAVLTGSPARHASASGTLFSDDFESGTMGLWTTSKSVVPEHTTVHTGTWAAGLTATGNGARYATATLASSVQEVTVSAWIDVTGLSTPVVLLRLRSSAGKPVAWVGLVRNGRLFTRRQGGTNVNSTTVFAKNGWHRLTLHLRLASGGNAMDVTLDGAAVPGLSSVPVIAVTTLGRFDIGDTATNRKYTIAFDDVSADSPQANPPPGPPTHLKATALPGGQEELSWDDSTDPDLAAYTVYRQDGQDWTAVGSPTESRFVDQGLEASTSYAYAVDEVDTSDQHSAMSPPVSGTTFGADAPPIAHIVVIDMENHSFDNVLGELCAEVAEGTITGRQSCDGATSAVTSDGSVVPLAQAADVVAGVDHSVAAQQTAIHGGAMDQFDLINGCTSPQSYQCMTQFSPSQIPNLAAMAETYGISDRTFEFSTSPSWVGHMVLASANQDGFQGDNPARSTFTNKKSAGWGCDSFRDANWWNGTQYILVPSCIPDRSGAGPYRTSPVPYVPTIFDRVQGAGLSWRIYSATDGKSENSGYGWAICPTFYECLSTQKSNWVLTQQVVTDGAAGKLPNFAIVAPPGSVSQHNADSMAVGDNWLGSVVGAIQSGPDWPNTAIFITYDDCGCFYDHVPPPQTGWGIRVPTVIVGPYVIPGSTDSGDATYASLLAYAEHVYGLPALSEADANAYDYAGSFDYGAAPSLARLHMVKRQIPASERDWIKDHPADEDDPT